MKITAIRTFRTDEFANVLWVHVETDSGLTGLGETFYGAEAVEAHIHNTLAVRLLGQDPLAIEHLHKEMLNLPMAQASTGVEYRAASAIDIALWDLFGKLCGQPVWQMLGGRCWERMRIYNTCAGTRYVRTNVIKPVTNWALGGGDGPYEDLDGFMNQPAALAEDLLANGITAMKIWPFDPHAAEFRGQHISATAMKAGLKPFEEIRKAVGDRIEIMLEMHSLWALPAAMAIAREVAAFKPLWFEDPIRMYSPQALAEFARATPVMTCASETLGLALRLQGLSGPRRLPGGDGRSLLDRRTDRGAQDRRDGRYLSPPLRAARLHRPGGVRRRDPHELQPAEHADPGIGPRFLQGLVSRTGDRSAAHRRRLRLSARGAGAGARTAVRPVRSSRPPYAQQRGPLMGHFRGHGRRILTEKPMRIVFHGSNAETFEPGFANLLETPHEIAVLSNGLDDSGETEAYAAADVVIGVRLTGALPRLSARLFQVAGAGTDAVDAALLPAECALCNVYGHEPAIAEYVMSALLARHVPLAEADGQLRRGDWHYWAGKPTGLRTELGAQTLGIVGFGHIGKAVAARAAAFGMRVEVANRSPVEAGGLAKVWPLDHVAEMAAGVDILLNTLPLTEQTRSLIGASVFAALPPQRPVDECRPWLGCRRAGAL